MLLHCVVVYCFCRIDRDRDKNHSAENDCYEHAEVASYFTLTILIVSSFICSKRECSTENLVSEVHAIDSQLIH